MHTGISAQAWRTWSRKGRWIEFFVLLAALAAFPDAWAGARAADAELPAEVRADIQFSLATNHMRAGRWTEAVAAFNEVQRLGVDPGGAFRLQFGKALLAAGRKEQAVAELTAYLVKSGERAPGFEEAIGLLYEHTRAPQLDAALAGGARIQVVTAFVRRDLKFLRWDWAASDLGELARLGELSEEWSYQRALANQQAGRPREAIEATTAYLKAFGRSGAHYNEAIVLYTRCQEEATALNRREEEQARREEARLERLGRLRDCRPDAPWTNSLGQPFLPLPNTNVLCCVWETRVRDYATYANEAHNVPQAWKDPGFQQPPDHPVIFVSWDDAKAYCEWLTRRERASGEIPTNRLYRLPTDAEWSMAVGIAGQEKGNTPAERDRKLAGVYPWGTQWPPPDDAGNYRDGEANSLPAKALDGFVYTAPVGSYKPNASGFHDLGGNVWEWCEDAYGEDPNEREARGGSWITRRDPQALLSASRLRAASDRRAPDFGFRVVLGFTPAP